jgi:branched-chain amino acid transport system substrate-binding protein
MTLSVKLIDVVVNKAVNKVLLITWLAVTVLTLGIVHGAKADVLIGTAGTMGGRYGWVGEQLQRGAEMAVADINTAGGILGQQVKLVTVDDSCDAAQAVAAANKLVADHVVAVIGHDCSDASIAASEIYETAGILQISPASTNPLFTDKGRGNVFRVVGRDDAQGAVAGNYIADRWPDKKIAILHDGSIYGKGLADETKKQLQKRGLRETVYEAFIPGKDDYTAEVTRLKEAGVGVVYVGGYHTEPALMARAASDRSYPLQIVSGDGMATEEFALIAGPAAEGAIFTFSPDPREYAEAQDAIKRFRADNFEPEGYTLFSYGAVQVWAQAVQKAGSLELSKVASMLHSETFDTVLGKITFDKKGDLTVQNWVWYIWKNGKYARLR